MKKGFLRLTGGRLIVLIVLFTSLCVPAMFAADQTGEGEHSTAEPSLALKWANFAILALGLGYLLRKQVPAFFHARTDQIQKAIKDATGLKLEADFRASAVDRKMATLGAEVDKMRDQSKIEMYAEHGRLEKETEAALAQINLHVTQEVANLQQNAANDLRRHVADLAASMASSRLRDHLTADEQAQLIRSFADHVRGGTI